MWIRTIAMLMLLVTAFDAGSIAAQNPPSPPRLDQPDALVPEFDLENVAGGRTKSVEIPGRVVVLNFWATWAVPSITEIPNLNWLHETFGRRGVQVLAIAADSGTVRNILTKVSEFGVKYSVLVADDKVTDDFRILGYPTTVVLTRDTQGWKIFKKYSGSFPGLTERIQKDIETLLGEK